MNGLFIEGSLNPCCNGICSRSYEERFQGGFYHVLILVVMEYALGVEKSIVYRGIIAS